MPWIHINKLARTSILKLFSGARKFFPQTGKKIQFDPLLIGEGIHKSTIVRKAATVSVLGIGGYAFLNHQTPVFAAAFEEGQDSVQKEKEALTDYLLRNEQEEEALLKLILEGLDKIESVKGKDIILLMGATGAGKSTLVNYLLGYKMKMINGVMEVDGQALAEIGHNPVRSQTLHIGVYEQDGRVYVDCPGLLDTRTSIERIWASLSTQLVIKNAAQIKGVVLVIDYASFVSMRGKPLLDLSESLTLFFTDTQALSNCLSLVITKTERYAVQSTSREITSFLENSIEEQKKRAQEIASKYGLDTYDMGNASTPSTAYKHSTFLQSEDRVKYEKLQRGISALSLMASAKITVTNLLEKQRRTEKDIQDKIDMLVAISPSKIIFERLSSRERRDFDNLIHGAASRGYRLFCRQQELLYGIRQEKYELDKPYSNEYEQVVIEYDKKIEEIVSEMDKIHTKKKTLEQQGEQEILVYKDSFDEKRNPLGIFGWSSKKFEYEGQPFIKISITKNDGSEFVMGAWFSGDGYFENVVLDENKGVYSSIYKSAYYHDGNVLVQIIGKLKYSNDFKQKMSIHDCALIAKKEALQKNREERIEFDRTFSEEERKKLNLKRLEKIKDDIVRLEESLSNLTENLQQRINGFIAIQRIYELLGDYTNENTDLMIQSFCKKLLKSEVYASHAQQLYKMARYNDAVKSYERAIEYDEDHEGILYEGMADSLSALGCFKEADDYYKKALENDIELTRRMEIDKKKLANSAFIKNSQNKLTTILRDENTEVFCHDPKAVEIGTAVSLFFGGLAYYYGISAPKSIAIGSVVGTVVGGGLAYQTCNQQAQQRKKSHL